MSGTRLTGELESLREEEATVARGRSPFASLGDAHRGSLYLLGLLGALKALSLVLIADALATGIVDLINVDLIHGEAGWRGAVLLGLVGALLRAFSTWAVRVVSVRTALGVKERLRAQLADTLLRDGSPRVGSMTTLATTGLDELDNYYTVFLPALINAATVPLLIGVRILFADWISALVIVVTIPLVPVFMVLIGMHTRQNVAAATDALGRLSEHMVELARGLPVLIGLGRAHEQTEALRQISEDYRRTSVKTLRTAFQSALALELLSTISVAMVAVFIGVRLIAGDMPLELGLVALILAPECFAPLREVGAAFHSSENGVEALRRVKIVVDAEAEESELARGTTASVTVSDLEVRYEGRARPVVSALDFAAARGVTLLDGASGTGKTTVLEVLAGVSAPDAVAIGTVTTPDAIAWLPQHPHPVADTVAAELLEFGDQDVDRVEATRQRATKTLRLLNLDGVADADPAGLSPGELRRLAFGRVLMRVDAGAQLVLLDEPTAHLDPASSMIVLERIRELGRTVTVIVASHDPAVRALAGATVSIGRTGALTASESRLPDPDGRAATATRPREAVEQHVEQHPVRELIAFLRPVAGRMLGAAGVGALSAAFAIALTAVSAWLIVRASEHPPILYLLVAMVGVRFFGIGRAALRYSERLLSHDAIFAALTGLRVRLWEGLAARGPANRALLGAGSTLDRLIGDADAVRDTAPRVVIPPLVGVIASAGAVVALWLIFPPAGLLVLLLAVVGLVLAPLLAVRADRAAGRATQRLRSASTRVFAGLLSASAELRANRSDGPVRRRLADLEAAAGSAGRRSAWALGVGQSIVVFACCAVAVLMLPLSATAVASGTLAAPLVAVLVMTPLGLIEPLLDVTIALQQWPTLRQVLGRVSTVTNRPHDLDAPLPDGFAGPVRSLELEGLGYRYPGAVAPAFAGLDAGVDAGDWLVVTGPSGSGKSTLLALMLRYLEPTEGRYLLNGKDAAGIAAMDVRRHVAWCPQEGHLFNSTLRANLLIARPRDDAPDSAEMEAVLLRAGLGSLLAELPLGLDTPIGSEGGFLSGGQRQRVAVARTLLARSDVVLVDEPTAHLDEEAATALMADLRVALADKVAVLVTHKAADIESGDRRLQLS